MFGYEFYIDPSRCIGCESCVNACAECETHRGHSMIHVDFIDRPSLNCHGAVCLHALRRSYLCAGMPGRRHQEERRRRRPVFLETSLHRLFQLRAGLAHSGFPKSSRNSSR